MRHAGRRAASLATGRGPAKRMGAGLPAGGMTSGLPRFLREAPVEDDVPLGTSAGKPLPEAVRHDFELDDTLDLSGVRIHDDTNADVIAASKGARALTQGQSIYFRSGAFAPDSAGGRRLLAHELTHTLQQGQRGDEDRDAMAVSDTSDPHEREADHQAAGWLRGEMPRVSQAPSGVLQREPDPPAPAEEKKDDKQDEKQDDKPVKPARNPLTADQAAALKPPLYTTYFDEVVPGILAGVEANGEVPYERALWLVTQSYGEQSPLQVHEDKSVSEYLPSEHHNRLFNEHATMQEDPKTYVKTPVPGQEHDGVHLYDLKQKEFLNGKWTETSSPTFGYDSTADSTKHHLALLKERRPGVYDALTEGSSFDGYVDALKASGYATEPAYVQRLKGLQTQVNTQVANWLRFRVPEMRQRIGKLEDYHQTLEESLAGWQEKFSDDDNDILEATLECVKLYFLIMTTMMEIEQTRTDLARLERFAGGIKVKIPEQSQE